MSVVQEAQARDWILILTTYIESSAVLGFAFYGRPGSGFPGSRGDYNGDGGRIWLRDSRHGRWEATET